VDSQTLMIVGVGVVVLILVLAAWYFTSRRQRVNLRERFGPEYERTVEAVGAERADSILRERAERVSRFNLRKLTQDQADAFAREWRRIQARFVDDPDSAVGEADQLVTQVMTARGYPLEDFDRRTDDLSVDHPVVVQNYRTARALALRRQQGEASTEEMRQALVNYRALFDELLEVDTRGTHRRAS
jgi:Na+-transporting methylmalonyl-CoA/oxaloacetate decarboxylase gamma subunit